MALKPIDEILSAKSRADAALKEIYAEAERPDDTRDVSRMMMACLRASRAAKVATEWAHGSVTRGDPQDEQAWRAVQQTLQTARDAASFVVSELARRNAK